MNAMTRTFVEDILTSKPQARPRIYAYSIGDEAHKGLLKAGQLNKELTV